MAIVELVEVFNGRHGSLDQNAVRTYSRVFKVRTNSGFDSPLDVLIPGNSADVTGVPSIRDPYVDNNGNVDFGAICTKVTPVQMNDDPFVWEVTCEYSSDKGNIEQRDQTIDDPLSRPPIFKISFGRYQKVATLNNSADLAAGAITNSAGEAFTPAPEMDDSRVVITMTRNEPWVDLSVVKLYQDTLNSDTFFGDPPLTWKLTLDAEGVYENSIYYWKVTYTFEYRAPITFNVLVPVKQAFGNWSFQTSTTTQSAWHLATLDQGFHHIDVNGNFVSNLDANMNPFADPQLLNGNGGLLQFGQPPAFIITQVYNSLPFALLQVPQVIF
jgi:hypothetical protein